jgi:hypothetical protein
MKIIEQTQTRLQLEAKPFTAWFFASAQLIAGLAFAYAYISTMPNSSNQAALASIVFLGFSVLTFLRSSMASITIVVSIRQGRNTVSLANPSTDKDNLTRITEVINVFLNC